MQMQGGDFARLLIRATKWFRGQMLVVKENDLMVEQCLADLANDLVGERPGEIDAGDFGAERARDPLSGNRVVIHRASSLTATHGRPANWRRYTNSGRVATRRSPRAGPNPTCSFPEACTTSRTMLLRKTCSSASGLRVRSILAP